MNSFERSKVIASRLAMLNSFTSIEDVAAFMRLGQFKGTREDSLSCPVANYLKHLLPVDASVSPTSFGIYTTIRTTGHQPQVIVSAPWTNQYVRAFIHAFDDGYYPDLEVGTVARRVWYAPWKRKWVRK